MAALEAWMVTRAVRNIIEEYRPDLDPKLAQCGWRAMVADLEKLLDEADSQIEADHERTYHEIVEEGWPGPYRDDER